MQLYDVKVYIKGADTIAKTQIPIWDIPTEEEEPLSGASAAAVEASCKETGAGDPTGAEAGVGAAPAGGAVGSPAADAGTVQQQAAPAAGAAASDRSACSSPSGSPSLGAMFQATTRILSLRPKARTAGVEASEPSMTGLPVSRAASGEWLHVYTSSAAAG